MELSDQYPQGTSFVDPRLVTYVVMKNRHYKACVYFPSAFFVISLTSLVLYSCIANTNLLLRS